MAEFIQFNEDETNSGPGRLGVTDTAIVSASDPTNMADFMDSSTYAFVTPFKDKGSTEGGITVTKTFAEQAFSVDLSNGDFGATPTGHSMAVETNLSQHGDLSAFKLAWFIDGSITQVTTTNEQVLGLAAPRAFVYRSLAVLTIYWKGTQLRAFYLRKVTNVAGDVAYALSPAALQLLPLRLRAYADTTVAASKHFGFIMQENGFGGITLP